MKNIAIIFMVLTSLLSCKSPQDLTEKDVYVIINEIFTDDSLRLSRVCSEFTLIELSDEMKNELTKQDVVFMERQQKVLKDITIKPNNLKWVHPRTKEIKHTVIDTLCNEGLINSISIPLVSIDRNKVFLKFETTCVDCILGGSGQIWLYEKQNGKWTKKKCFDCWIS